MGAHINTIILVDDEQAHSALVERNLRRVGYKEELIKLEGGQQLLDMMFGLASYKERPTPYFPLILLDLNMPGKNGISVLKELKNNEKTNHVPVIVLSTSDDPTEIEQCYRLGCNAYIVKPVMADEFKETIGKLGRFLNIVGTPSTDSKTN